jgi:DNA recombination protein RmuC
LYAEVWRPVLVDRLQRESTWWPGSTLWMLLNSLQMGFRTLQIEQRSSEVWETLGKAKQDFAKFGDVMSAVHKKLQEATNKVDEVRRSTRRIQRTLREVDAPAGALADPLADVTAVPLFAEGREPMGEP